MLALLIMSSEISYLPIRNTVGDRADGIRIARRVSRIARIADRDEIDVERVRPTAEGDCSHLRRGQQRKCRRVLLGKE